MIPTPLARLGLMAMNAAPAWTSLHRDVDQLVSRLRKELQRGDEPLALTARITPLDGPGAGESREVRLANFSERGIAIEHGGPLAERRAVVSFESPALGRIAAEVDLSWCRYQPGGRYTSGGRFVQVLEA